jgi:hypothetical protein
MRFKTEKEMIKSHGRNWRIYSIMNQHGEMDYLLGQPVPKVIERRLQQTGKTEIKCNRGRWWINKSIIAED